MTAAGSTGWPRCWPRAAIWCCNPIIAVPMAPAPAFMAAGKGQWGRRMQSDLADGVRYLVERRSGRSGARLHYRKWLWRLCGAGGRDHIGHLSLRGCARRHIRYRRLCELGEGQTPPAGPGQDRQPDSRCRMAARLLARSGVSLNRHRLSWRPAGWNALSPRNQIADVKAPVLLVHQADDRAVPLRQSKAMRDALQAAGKAVTYVELPGSDHALTTEEARLATAEVVVDFLKIYNPN